MGRKISSRLNHEPLHEAMRRDSDHAKGQGRSIAWLATKLDKSPEWLYAVLRGELPFNYELIPMWCQLTESNEVLKALCADAGMVAVSLPPLGNIEFNGLRDAYRHQADFIQAVCDGLEDNTVDISEAERVDKEGTDLIAKVHEIMMEFRRRATTITDLNKPTLREASGQ